MCESLRSKSAMMCVHSLCNTARSSMRSVISAKVSQPLNRMLRPYAKC